VLDGPAARYAAATLSLKGQLVSKWPDHTSVNGAPVLAVHSFESEPMVILVGPVDAGDGRDDVVVVL